MIQLSERFLRISKLLEEEQILQLLMQLLTVPFIRLSSINTITRMFNWMERLPTNAQLQV
jgi:hypothetical protein